MQIYKACSINGEIPVPGDKSISHRSAIIASLTKETVIINNYLFSEDCINTLEVLKKLGVKIEKIQSSLIVHGNGLEGFNEPDDILYVGNSGTTIRLMCGVLSAAGFFSVLSGDRSVNKRPMARIIEPLARMGANIMGRCNNTKAPLVIKGNNSLNGIVFKSDISSAQVKSALIFAGLFADSPTEIIQPEISRDHTEKMLEYFGADIKYDGRHTIIYPGSKLQGRNIYVPCDISSAAYFIVASLILRDSHIKIKNAGFNPTRASYIDVLKKMGAEIKVKNQRILNNEEVADIEAWTSSLEAVSIGTEIIPNIIDEIPVLCVAASFAEGITEITGAQELRFKESDRISVIASQFKKAGADIVEKDDGFLIRGKRDLKISGGTYQSFSDHRIAMSLAVLGLKADEEFNIEDSECIDTSFPEFKYLLKKAIENH
ncbi:MAG: 3-phosphoshikimate 1-carboxyvinyltransferase [Actinobacteria bacterium]|nr:3-phosphoshikimate 1-carboxyvinyltransferase [Actinomycetota bacterium]